MYAIRSYYGPEQGGRSAFGRHQAQVTCRRRGGFSGRHSTRITSYNVCYTKLLHAILTNDLANAEAFVNGAGSAAVYVNASTRFTDGAQFGLGAEVAVSTQKLHARGPMGLTELTSYKWVGVITSYSIHYTKLYEFPVTPATPPVLGGSSGW